MKFEEVYIEYLKYIEYRQKNQSQRTLKERFEKKILPFFKDYNIYDIKESDYLKWQNDIEFYNYSNNYKSNLHYLMTKYFDFLIKYYDVQKNVPRNVGNFKLKNEAKKYKIYSYKEFRRFIKYVDNNIYKQFFNFMFFTGTRPGETFALQFKDIQNDYISINKTLTSHNGREFDLPKSYNSVRMIKLDKKLKNDILDLKKQYVDCNDDYFIFGGPKPLAPTTINRYKVKACQKANLRPITLHQFRHSHATLLVNNNVLINEVSRRLGHSNVAITLNTYVHTDLSQEKKVYKTLNSLRYNFFRFITKHF